MNRDDAVLLDIARAARLTQLFIQDITREQFFVDLKTQSAVVHQLMVLGEAVKRLSLTFRDLHPILPWHLMAGMRDHLIHGYDAVDVEEVWNTVVHDIPQVLAKIEPLLPQQS